MVSEWRPVFPLAEMLSAGGSVGNSSALPCFSRGSNRTEGPGPGQEPPSDPTPIALEGCYTDRTTNRGFLEVFDPARGFMYIFPTTLASIEFMSSDRIKALSVGRLCSIGRCFTSH